MTSSTAIRKQTPNFQGRPFAPPAASDRLGTIVHFCLQPDGGVWSHIRLLARNQKAQWRVQVVAVNRGALRAGVVEEAEECCDRSLLVMRPAITGIYYLAPVNVERVLREIAVDPSREHVVLHFHTGPCTTWFFRLSSETRGTRLVTFHGSRGNFNDTGLRGLPRRLLGIRGTRKLVREGFRFIAISRQSARDCARMYRVPEEQFRVAYSGVIAAAAPRPPRQSTGSAPFHVGFLGTIKAAKGWHRVISAVRLLRERGRNVLCSIAGDGSEFSELSAIASTEGWLQAPGRIPDPAISFLPTLDVLVVPSDYEGLPLVLPEAMSCGVPCICSNVGGCAEAVRDGHEGVVLQTRSPQEIAEAIDRLMNDLAFWHDCSRNARQRYEEMFTPEQMCSSLEDLYGSGCRD